MRSNVPCAIGGDPAEHDLASELPMKSVIRGDYTKSSTIRTNIDGSSAQDGVEQHEVAGRERVRGECGARGNARSRPPPARAHGGKPGVAGVGSAAKIASNGAVQLGEGCAGPTPPQPALNPGIRDHQLERR